MPDSQPIFAFDNSFAREMDGFFVPWQGASVPKPEMILFNDALAEEMGLDADSLNSPQGAAYLTGSEAPLGADPLAQVYAGHQFGGFSPQLGDGRALLLGELVGGDGLRRDLHLKGSGPTPFSRGGDGKAVLGPVLREYIMGEAMHGLGIPTTRALSACITGEEIKRDGWKIGAVLARVASSHIRVGTFQYFAARGEQAKLRYLADYAIARHGLVDDSDLKGPDRYHAFFASVVDRQARLIACWMLVGFVHGVMNTDNVSIAGETIDYGPCAFLDAYQERAVFSSIDRGGRYAYGNQPGMAQWNLARFAECLLPLLHADTNKAVQIASDEIARFGAQYQSDWLDGMRRKIGIVASKEVGDEALISGLLRLLEREQVDFTLAFRALTKHVGGDLAVMHSLMPEARGLDAWLECWQARLARDEVSVGERSHVMGAANPVYIPRNHMVEAALYAAEAEQDYGPARQLIEVVSKPYQERAGLEEYAQPAPPDFGPYRTFCGT